LAGNTRDVAATAIGDIGVRIRAADPGAAGVARAGVEVAEGADAADAALGRLAAANAIAARLPSRTDESEAAAVLRVIGEIGAEASVAAEAEVAVWGGTEEGAARERRERVEIDLR
jgi:hypothetical protein